MHEPLTQNYRPEDRALAAECASRQIAGSGLSPQWLDDCFTQYLALISGARLRIVVGDVTYPQGGYPGHQQPTIRNGNGAVQMKDTQQVHAAIVFDDAKGFATVDPNAVSWSVADPSVCTAQPDTDGSGGCTFVAGNPGSTVATVTDGVVSGTVAIDVTPGDVASIAVSLGDPVDQPAPAVGTPSAPTS